GLRSDPPSAARPADVVMADVGGNPRCPLRPRVPGVRALPGELRAVARAPSGELRDAVRRSGVRPNSGEHDCFSNCWSKPEVPAGAIPVGTLILMAGRLAIPKELYEASSVDGASAWQKFRFVTWPSIRTLYLTSTLLSIIWTLGDFNSVYLLTGGGPADLTHVLATLGI